MTHPGDLLSALLDGELSEDDESTVRKHLTGCALCTAELDRVAQARETLRALPVLEPPLLLLPAARRGPRWVKAVASVAAGALVAGLAVAPGTPDETFDVSTIAGQHTSRAGVDPSISPLIAPGAGP